MIDLALPTIKMLLVMHPLMAVATWIASAPEPSGRQISRRLLLVAVGAVLVLVISALFAELWLELFDVSQPTFTMATGTLVLLSVIPVWTPVPRLADDQQRSWQALVRLWLWLASPAVVILAAQLSLDEGGMLAIDASLLAMLLALAILLIVPRLPNRIQIALPWLARLLSIAVVLIGIDLIRDGIQAI